VKIVRECRVEVVAPQASIYDGKPLLGRKGVVVDISVGNTDALVIIDGDLMHDLPLASLKAISAPTNPMAELLDILRNLTGSGRPHGR